MEGRLARFKIFYLSTNFTLEGENWMDGELIKDKAMRDILATNGRNAVIQKYHYSRLIRDIEELREQLLIQVKPTFRRYNG